jgi:mannosyltransferase
MLAGPRLDRMTPARWGGVAACAVVALIGLVLPSDRWLYLLGVASDGGLRSQGALVWRFALVITAAFCAAGIQQRWWRSANSARDRRSVLGDPALIALLVVATVLRLYRLGDGLWIDEVTTLVDYAQKPFGHILTTYDSNNQHSLFSLLAHGSIVLFGDTAWSLRLPAALLGIGSIAAVYALGREVASRSEALLAAALLTFSYQHVWFSQNARGYSGLLLLATVSSLFLIRGLRHPDDGRSWLGFAVSTALGMYVHLTMIFVVVAQFTALIVEAWRGWPRFRSRWVTPLAGGFVAAGLFTILLYALILPQVPGASARDTSGIATWRNPVWMLTEMVRGLQLGAAGGVVAAAGLVVMALGIADFWRRERAIVILLIVSVASGALVMMALGHHLWPRFFIYAGGFGALVGVRGVMRGAGIGASVLRWSPARGRAIGTALLVLGVVVLGRSLRWVYGPKQDYAGARNFVEASRGRDDAVVSVGVARWPMNRYYAPQWSIAESLPELQRIMSEHPRTWLVFTLRVAMESEHPDVLALLRRDFQLQRVFNGSLGDGAIYVYLYNRGPAAPPGRSG